MAKCFINDTTLTNIGNAIRGVNGSSDLMLPSAMPDAISLLNSGLYVWSKYNTPISEEVENSMWIGSISQFPSGGLSEGYERVVYYSIEKPEIVDDKYVLPNRYVVRQDGYPTDNCYFGSVLVERNDSPGICDKTDEMYYGKLSSSGRSISKTYRLVRTPTAELLGYVVSNGENAYPNKAVHIDGFYYEKYEKKGTYVWSKYEISPSILTLTGDGTAGNNTGSAAVLQHLNDFVGSPYYDSDYNYVGTFEMPDIADIANVAGYYYISSNSNVYYIDTITPDSVTFTYWDSSSYSVSDEIKTFLDYAVSDDVNTYPDKATHTDGYWYEKFDNSTLIPENIREGIDIWGVVGTLVEGVAGIDFGEVTLASASETVTVNHALGVTPSFVALIPKSLESASGATLINVNGNAIRKFGSSWYINAVTNTLTDASIVFGTYSSSYKYPAKDYYWIAIA